MLSEVVMDPNNMTVNNLHTRSWRRIMLNAKLKSRNSLLTWVFFPSKSSRLRWRAVEVVRLVYKLEQVE